MMAPAETRMFAEAADAAEVVARQATRNREPLKRLGAALRTDRPRALITCARGSSDHAATYLKHLVETRARVLVASASPSVASLYRASPDARQMWAIGMSQSGKSPDIIAAMQGTAEAGARTLAMVNVVPSPLAALADEVLPLEAGVETSVAATKSFIALLATSASLVAAWTQDQALQAELERLPALLRAAWGCDWTPLVSALTEAKGLYVIGRGPAFGIAQEAALKLKETCGLHAEAFSAAEVRHGPLALVGPDLPLLVFSQDDESRESTDMLIKDALTNGARVLVAGAEPPSDGAVHLPLPPSDPVLAPVLAVQAFYRAANGLSLARGFDPDRPPHLNKVTETV